MLQVQVKTSSGPEILEAIQSIVKDVTREYLDVPDRDEAAREVASIDAGRKVNRQVRKLLRTRRARCIRSREHEREYELPDGDRISGNGLEWWLGSLAQKLPDNDA